MESDTADNEADTPTPSDDLFEVVRETVHDLEHITARLKAFLEME